MYVEIEAHKAWSESAETELRRIVREQKKEIVDLERTVRALKKEIREMKEAEVRRFSVPERKTATR